jgi:hypothetical protein
VVLLSAAVVVLAALLLVDLVLTFAIIRRLREIETKLIDMNTPPESGLPVGEPMPEFAAADGTVSRADLAGGPALIGFFSAGCRHCPAQAEELADRAEELTAQGVRLVSFLSVGDGAVDELSPTLRKAGPLVTEPEPSLVAAAFQESATPAFVLFGADGRLTARGHDLDEVLSRR